ncbi:MAG: DUF5317 domain-containing protein [Candidatus Bipolaricaulota bacterium]|nr:DUF5317 domain-containing protein [Candidatus Bipolaricaulota bacterium]MDW8126392.1 DUF5317 domain-containing protein [Candidatus Bipolaricaulota bacterium]
MPLLWAVVIGLGLGYLQRGRIRNLANLRLRGLWLLLPPLVLQLLIFPLGSHGPIVPWGTPYWHIVSYLFLVGFTLWNWRYAEIVVMGLGLLLNFLAIVANGGYMPASAEALRRAGLASLAQALQTSTYSGNTVLMSHNTHLNPLGDWLYLPAWIPLSSAFSPGDLVLGLGAAFLLARRMVHR